MLVYIVMIVGLVFIGLALRVPFAMRKDYLAKKHWKSLPTADEYMAAIATGNGRGICCIKCGSNQIWEQHLISGQRIHYCRQCKTDLYGTGGERK
ncbi:hypothetical protein [Stutzerimonas kunmingensis]|uniref:hypothetical protein n=1 Tax=Stutzerimonas kunmingensis TaxID=1211807 RepID=UPI00241C0420|nr:hypothetical protein [Stutzerimonas kunmingensis]